MARGTREDESGELAERQLAGSNYAVADRVVVPDEQAAIIDALRAQIESGTRLIVTTGGTGFGPRDVTPEATSRVIERPAPGLSELMRAAGLEHTPLAALSRGVAGAAGSSLILNLPGSPKGVKESLDAVEQVLPHALRLLGGDTEHT